MRTTTNVLILVALATLLGTTQACAQADLDQIRTAVTDGLQIVQDAARNYPKHRGCFSCHHQTLPMLAMELAAQKDVEVDRELLQDQADFTWKTFKSRQAAVAEALSEPVQQICEMAHAHQALVYVDAVHYGPHGLIDVKDWNCDITIEHRP